MNNYAAPFPSSEQIVAALKQGKMLQEPAPRPWYEAELEYIKKASA